MRGLCTDLADYYVAGTGAEPLMTRILHLIPLPQRTRATTGKPAKPAASGAPLNLGVYELVRTIAAESAEREHHLRQLRGGGAPPTDTLDAIRQLANHAEAVGYQHPYVQQTAGRVALWHKRVLEHVGHGIQEGRYIPTDVLAQRLNRSEHAAYMWCRRNHIQPVGLAPRGHTSGGSRVAVWDWVQVAARLEMTHAKSTTGLR